jgi:putative transposase
MVAAPFADFTWRHARRLAAAAAPGGQVTEAEIARALDELLTRAEHGPDRASAKVAARTRAGAAAHRPVLPEPTPPAEPVQPDAQVIPFGIFDADAEAERWI